MSSSQSSTEVKVVAAPAAINQAGKVAIVTGASRYVPHSLTHSLTHSFTALCVYMYTNSSSYVLLCYIVVSVQVLHYD